MTIFQISFQGLKPFVLYPRIDQMTASFHYQEYPASLDLSSYIKCYWTYSDQRATDHIRNILPDGCVDIILNGFGKYYYQNLSQKMIRPEMVGILGTQTGPCRLGPCETEDVAGFGIRFQPGAVFSALRVTADAFQDGFVTLQESSLLLSGLPEKIFSNSSFPSRQIPFIEAALRENLQKWSALHPSVSRSVFLIQESQGQIRMETLCDKLGLTRQHLNRLFLKHVGLSPKTFCRIARFNALVKRLRDTNQEATCALAYDLGYYDQSHLIAEFKEFSGLTPAQFSEEMFHFSKTLIPAFV